MDKTFCRKIDEELLIEQYVKGTLPQEMRSRIEEHLETCPVHAQALRLEKLLHHGITEYGRYEMKQRLQKGLRRSDDTRILILRFAAILFVAVFIPVVLYYGIYINRSEPPSTDEEYKLPMAPVAEAEQPSPASETKWTEEQTISRSVARQLKRIPSLKDDWLNIDPDSVAAASAIREELIRVQDKIKQCAADFSRKVKAVGIEFSLTPEGKIGSVNFSDELRADREVTKCIERILEDIKFPHPGTTTKVYYRFFLDPVKVSPVPEDADTP